MPRPDFEQFAKDLRRAGIAERHIRRAALELSDHFEDLVEDAILDGHDRTEAELRAAARLGDINAVGEAISARPELRGWAFRWPRIAMVLYPLACVAALPAAPVIAGVQNAPVLARWEHAAGPAALYHPDLRSLQHRLIKPILRSVCTRAAWPACAARLAGAARSTRAGNRVPRRTKASSPGMSPPPDAARRWP